MITHGISLLVGAAASYGVWWLLNHIWIPEVRFGPEVCKYEVGKSQALYVCAFENSGRRDIIDVEVVTRIGVKKFKDAESWIYFSIKTNASRVPAIKPCRRALVRIFDERLPPVFIDEPPPSLKETLADCKTLDDIFSISPEVRVQLHVFGYDGFSGSRHHYESPMYSKQDVRSGRLKGLIVVQG